MGRIVYCVEDTTVFLVDNSGIKKDTIYKNYSRSPANIKTTTITDEMKLFSNSRSKVIGLSLKDRGAICPAGHLANAAYWYNSINGNFVTSSYYQSKLPSWLKDFNNQKRANSLLNLTWKTLLPIEKYSNSESDDVGFEKVFIGRNNSTFPYDLKKLRMQNGNFGLLTGTPFGNTLLTEMAMKTILGEHLGKGKETDFLTISYSSTDYVGHNFSIRSKELEDTYVRLDRELAQLLSFLDKKLGKGNYLLFLTADHASSDNPVFLNQKLLPGNFFDMIELKEALNVHLSKKFGNADYISFMDKTQVYFNNDIKVSKEKILDEALNFLIKVEGIKDVFAPVFKNRPLNNSSISLFIKNSYNPKESGDILYQMYSGWMQKRIYGTTHGTSYTSDTHVPLLWYGWKVPQGNSVKKYTITQIAPTLSMFLDIPLPNASCSNPILELF